MLNKPVKQAVLLFVPNSSTNYKYEISLKKRNLYLQEMAELLMAYFRHFVSVAE